ncbi:MAG: hypothetical protein ABI723_11445, partial [Bacteroidia bacterium]
YYSSYHNMNFLKVKLNLFMNSWNGINPDNEKAKIGIYILYSEIFNTKGDVKKYKNTFVVGG